MRRALLPCLAAAVVVVLLLLSGGTGRTAGATASRAREGARPPDVVCAVGEEAAADPAGTAIVGSVVDEHGRPFAGARVRVFPFKGPDLWTDAVPSSAASSAETGADGRFRLPAAGGAASLVMADAKGYVPAVATVRAGAEAAALALTLAAGKLERIRVTDEEGRPAAGAEALVFQQGETLRTRVAADDDGWIEACLAKRELLVVRAPGFAWELIEPPVEPPVVVLEREYRLAGIVRFADGRPAPGVRIEFDRYLWREEITTGPDGRFAAGGFGEGELELTVTLRDSDFECVYRVLTVQPGDETIEVVFGTANVEGVVLLPDRRPAAGAYVSGGSGGHCDDAGRFVLREVDPGGRTLSASLEDLSGRVELDVGAKDIRDVTIVLDGPPPAARSVLRVFAVDPGGAPVAAGVRVRYGDGDSSWRRVDREGGEITVPRPSGTAVLLFADADPANPRDLGPSAASEAVTGGPDVMLRLRPPVPVTMVCLGVDGAPIDRATIEVSGLCHVLKGPDGPGRTRYLFRADDPGSAEVLLVAKGFAPTRVRGWKPPADGGEVVFRLAPAVRIAGQAFSAKDGDAASLRAQLIGDCSFESQDRSGRFQFDAAPGAKVTLVVWRGAMPGFATNIELPSKGTVDLGAIRIEAPWLVNGSVVDPSGAPVGGAVVTVQGPGYEGRAATRGDGTFRISLPPSDLYAVHVEKGTLSTGPLVPSELLRKAEPIRLKAGP